MTMPSEHSPDSRSRSQEASSTIDLVVRPAINSAPLDRSGEPVTVGVPLPPALAHDPESLALVDGSDAPLPLQTRVLERWADGSIRWVLLDFQATVSGGTPARYKVLLGANSRRVGGLTASERAGTVDVDTGPIRVRFGPGERFPFRDATTSSRQRLDTDLTRLRVTDAADRECQIVVTRASLEESGTLRAVVLVEGQILDRDRRRMLDVMGRFHFFAGLPTVRVALTLRNPRKADHPGGFWTLGSAGSVYIRDACVTIAPVADEGRAELLCSPEAGSPLSAESELELYQDSSGGENWRSANHRNRHGVVPLQFRGYYYRTTAGERQGLRATPIVVFRRGRCSLAMAMPHFWQNFPKAIAGSPDGIALHLYPRQYRDLHEIQGGEQKTHTFYVAFDADTVSESTLAWTRAPLVCHADPRWYCSSGAAPYLLPAAEDPNTEYLQLVQAAVDGASAFEHRREAIDEYGWRNFGDIYADHEARFHTGPEPLISHYNNQYDAVAGFAYQFLRSGDPRWWNLLTELAAHVIDIDIYHTDQDKAAYNRGLFWHTAHYVDVGLASHRSFPQAPTVSGGGPAPEHNYTTGLMLHYFLTGNPASRETVIDLGRWVIDMDDGRKTSLRWLSRGNTGLASVTGSICEHGPGRGPGNSINALLDAHRLSGDPIFLEKAEQLIRRGIHPADDIDARDLLDAERKWYYTVFLQSLGKYLDRKTELRQADRMYAYARASLITYARWMASHEYPYLDKPQILEYPTETWAAQDMRKSEVFKFAALHASGKERERFLERARFFFDYSVSTLRRMPTSAHARPLILMLSYGFMQGFVDRHPGVAAPTLAVETADFGTPEVFVPQKLRAKKQFALVMGTLILLLLGAAGWIL